MSDHNFLIDRLEKWQADPSNGINENGRTRRLLKEAASALRSVAPAAPPCDDSARVETLKRLRSRAGEIYDAQTVADILSDLIDLMISEARS